MGARELPPNVSQEIILQTSAQSDKAIQSYPSAGVLIVARINFLYCFLMVMNHLFGDP